MVSEQVHTAKLSLLLVCISSVLVAVSVWSPLRVSVTQKQSSGSSLSLRNSLQGRHCLLQHPWTLPEMPSSSGVHVLVMNRLGTHACALRVCARWDLRHPSCVTLVKLVWLAWS